MKNGLPGADILGLLWHDAAELSGDFPSVDPNLKQVVNESQDRSQREGGHEQGHKAELNDCDRQYMCYKDSVHITQDSETSLNVEGGVALVYWDKDSSPMKMAFTVKKI